MVAQMAEIQLPTVKAVHDLLNDIFGRDVDVVAQAVFEPKLAPDASVGVYRDEAKNLVAVVVADLALSAYLAAGLALTSKNDAEETVRKGMLPGSSAETMHEILNIMSTLFNDTSSRHVRFHALHPPKEPVPPLVSARATTTGRRLDVTVSVPGYGSGQMSLVL